VTYKEAYKALKEGATIRRSRGVAWPGLTYLMTKSGVASKIQDRTMDKLPPLLLEVSRPDRWTIIYKLKEASR
jgi:hypothetical protein